MMPCRQQTKRMRGPTKDEGCHRLNQGRKKFKEKPNEDVGKMKVNKFGKKVKCGTCMEVGHNKLS